MTMVYAPFGPCRSQCDHHGGDGDSHRLRCAGYWRRTARNYKLRQLRDLAISLVVNQLGMVELRSAYLPSCPRTPVLPQPYPTP
ncbi:hypothetical protein DACRYDRAFT_116684 [Dacryopinax primogenitus]|uniref:Uncharacterized protein n=1 Tax=Dacryopinax primogenitus (strain DJM 731) TaxID=1858805 RepID=M5FYH0_DACPD|nr:uncharacterized protein DACRYDRAFT_116684 [Dacryopinax primogenitus]EJU01569.1 hypothetical protein DACRYDRAFT_116684 [Dacryopinax primogenitus]